MVTSVANQQIPAANTFKPGPTVAEQLVKEQQKFDDTPKTRVEQLDSRNTERRAELAKEIDNNTLYSAEGTSSGSGSSRGGNLDISI